MFSFEETASHMFARHIHPLRFWATPAVSNSSRTNAIPPLLVQVFPEGLAPLSDKIDELVERSERHLRDEIQEQRMQYKAAAAAAAVGRSPPSSPVLGGRGRQSTPAGLRMQRIQVSVREGYRVMDQMWGS